MLDDVKEGSSHRIERIRQKVDECAKSIRVCQVDRTQGQTNQLRVSNLHSSQSWGERVANIDRNCWARVSRGQNAFPRQEITWWQHLWVLVAKRTFLWFRTHCSPALAYCGSLRTQIRLLIDLLVCINNYNLIWKLQIILLRDYILQKMQHYSGWNLSLLANTKSMIMECSTGWFRSRWKRKPRREDSATARGICIWLEEKSGALWTKWLK